MTDIQEKFTLVKDLSKIYYMRKLRDLLHVFSTYHIESIPIPSVYSLARDGYKAIVCSELNMDTGDYYWKSALLFRIVRERRAIWHTIVQVDYIVIDPSRKKSFSSMSDSIRILTQFVERQSKASRLDIMVRLDTQMNSTIYLHTSRKLILEGLHNIGDGFIYMKRLRDIDPKTGRNKVMAPLPVTKSSAVEGMHPLVQSAILPKKRRNGGLISFVGRVKKYGGEYQEIYEFCEKNSQWEHPKLDDRVSYMQSVFPSTVSGNVKDYVDSLCNDAQFIKLTNPKGHIVALMAMVAGYSTPATTPKDDDWVSPERVVFVPLVMCQSGTRRRWTKVGFMQAQELYKEMFRILKSEGNKDRYDMIACMVAEGSIHAGLLRTVGFKRTATFQSSVDNEVLSYYAMTI
jgi:ribosomal protein L31E